MGTIGTQLNTIETGRCVEHVIPILERNVTIYESYFCSNLYPSTFFQKIWFDKFDFNDDEQITDNL